MIDKKCLLDNWVIGQSELEILGVYSQASLIRVNKGF